ncbi:MAG: 30S ribosomal protein S18 [bacterium]
MQCFFCQHNTKEIDYKDIKLLERFISGLSKIRAKKRTGVCSSHQRKLAQAIKRARFLALLPFTPK